MMDRTRVLSQLQNRPIIRQSFLRHSSDSSKRQRTPEFSYKLKLPRITQTDHQSKSPAEKIRKGRLPRSFKFKQSSAQATARLPKLKPIQHIHLLDPTHRSSSVAYDASMCVTFNRNGSTVLKKSLLY
mmetsp:Transcript_17311/g.31196  ORF Transcript_17311/g.31196 Transcript_17311/m.31196 type:complete len:128 (+) Transcript_17311:352-735(+)